MFFRKLGQYFRLYRKAKKFKSVSNFKCKCNKLIFFRFFVSFFRYPLFSGKTIHNFSKLFLQKFFLWSRNWGNAKKPNYYWVSLLLKLILLQKGEVQFVDLRRSRHLSACGQFFDQKVFHFDPFVRILMVRNSKICLQYRFLSIFFFVSIVNFFFLLSNRFHCFRQMFQPVALKLW